MKSMKLIEEKSYQSGRHRLPKGKFKRLTKATPQSLLQFDPMKFCYHTETIQELIANGDVISPITLDVDPTNRCNQNCIWCSFDYLHRDLSMLEEKLFLKLVSDLTEFKKEHGRGVKSIIFTGGGEPTLNPALARVLEICKESQIRCGIYTNGTFTSELRETILGSCDFIRFSLEASNEGLYSRLHRPQTKDAFRQVTQNIRALADMKREKGQGPDIGISFLLDPLNLTDMVASAERARELGADYFQVKPVIKKAWEKQRLTTEILEQAAKAYKQIESIATENFKVIIIKQKLDDIVSPSYGRSYPKCLGHFLSSVITADGKVYVCVEHRGLKKYVMGDLHQQEFYEIWNSQRRQEVINSINLNECQPGCKGHFRTLQIERIKNIRHVDFI